MRCGNPCLHFNGSVQTVSKTIKNFNKTFYLFIPYTFMNCILCGNELKSPCEELYGICKDDAGKVKQIMGMAMSFAPGGKL